eukprot:CAMPEP_0171214334 /NCGR_PEP_ID=MMETSP0790-20130122/31104_1 /TAXON_ID=2925 /ORGANISM="Alexandrium catenella, Strain OF101" /LENGTH=511 /DNA_ID=CAMNT_0011680065 /DNA_START=86 /DNA_END=1618 /DNA_ORIENTATION=-
MNQGNRHDDKGSRNRRVQQRNERVVEEVGQAYDQGCDDQRDHEAHEPDQPPAQLREDGAEEGDHLDERQEGREQRVEPAKQHQPAEQAEPPDEHAHPRVHYREALIAALAALEEVVDSGVISEAKHMFTTLQAQQRHQRQPDPICACAAKSPGESSATLRRASFSSSSLMPSAQGPADQPVWKEAVPRAAGLLNLQREHRSGAVRDIFETCACVADLGVAATVLAVDWAVELAALLLEGGPALVPHLLAQARLGGGEVAALGDEVLGEQEALAVLDTAALGDEAAKVEPLRLVVILVAVIVVAGVVPRRAPLRRVAVGGDGVLATPELLLLLLLLVLDVLEHLDDPLEPHTVVLEDHVELRVGDWRGALHCLTLQMHDPVPVVLARCAPTHRPAFALALADEGLHFRVPALVEPEDWEGEDDEDPPDHELGDGVLQPTKEALVLHLRGGLHALHAQELDGSGVAASRKQGGIAPPAVRRRELRVLAHVELAAHRAQGDGRRDQNCATQARE